MKKNIIIILLLFASVLDAQTAFRLVRKSPAATGIPPTLGTQNYLVLSDTHVDFSGYLNPNGVSTVSRWLLGTASDTYTDSLESDQSPLTGSSTQLITASFTGLTPSTTYYAKQIAYNVWGRVEHTAELSFTTEPEKVYSNLVINGDIENPALLNVTSPIWSFGGSTQLTGDTIYVSSSSPIQDSNSLVLGYVTDHTLTRPMVYFSLTEPLDVAKEYKFKIKTEVISGSPRTALVNYASPNQSNFVKTFTGSQTYIDSPFVPTSAATTIYLYFAGGVGGSAGTIKIDDVILEEIPTTDITAPTIVSATIQDNTPNVVNVVLSENCIGTTGFSIDRNSVNVLISSTNVSGSAVTLTLNTAISPGDVMSISYDSGSGDVSDVNYNNMASFTDTPITNLVNNPYLVSARVENANPDEVIVTFNEPVDFTGSLGFTIEVDIIPVDVNGLSGSGTNTITIELKAPIAYGEGISIAYDETIGNVADNWDNPLLNFGAAVTNNVYPPANAPLVITGSSSQQSPTTFSVSGQVDPQYDTTSVYVSWGSTSSADDDSNLVNAALIGGGSYQTLSSQISGLTEGLTYYYKYSAFNDSGYTVGGTNSFLVTPFSGITYYISSSGGNDDNTGTSEGQAWATLAKLNANWGSIDPGDRILFKRGDTFAPTSVGPSIGVIQPTTAKSGTADNHIVLGAYGTGEKPIISNENVSGYSEVIRGQSLAYFTFENISFTGSLNFRQNDHPQGSHNVRFLYCDFIEARLSFTAPIEHDINLIFPCHSIEIGYCTFNYNSFGGEDIINLGKISPGPQDGTPNVWIHHNTIYKSYEEAIDIGGGTGNIVEYNLISGTTTNGIKMHSQHSRLDSFVVRGNVILHVGMGYNFGDTPYQMANGTALAFISVGQGEVYNNVISSRYSLGIAESDQSEPTYGRMEDVNFYNNIIQGVMQISYVKSGTDVHGDTFGSNYYGDEPPLIARGIVFSNNIYSGHPVDPNKLARFWQVPVEGGGQTVNDPWTVYTANWATAWEERFSYDGNNEIQDNPDFVNPTWTDFYNYGDWSLQAVSPGIDAGINTTGYNVDIEGNPVPVNTTTDIGAYERQ